MFTNNQLTNHSPVNETKNTLNETHISHDNNYNEIDRLLEKEKLRNKSDAWNKIDKTVKTQKLHQFAERYGKDHGYPSKDIKLLKSKVSNLKWNTWI